MNWRGKKVSEELDPRGKTINEIMRWYYEDSLIVNRRYQRKLVWTLGEKQLFIDSIINKYPTPSIILSAYENKDNLGNIKTLYEIIDGLQRLNAIVSFVNNEFGVIDDDGKEYFYDIQYTPTALTKKNNGELQQQPLILHPDICQDFAGFEMPIILTTQRVDRDKKIEQIFSRINSSGRKLSAHDLRQASSVGEFPDLVRRIAANSRGDHTFYDEVNLCDMPKISINSKGLNYDINPNNMFWIRHDIIPFPNLRQSKDEEIIASILAILLLGKDNRINTNTLNSLYRSETNNSNIVSKKINEIGKDNLEQFCKNVFDQIDMIFESVDSNFTDYLYPKKNAKAKDISFILLFCAIYQLNREAYIISDYKTVAKTLKNIYSSTFKVISQNSKHEKRVEILEIFYNCLKAVMEPCHPRKQNSDDRLLENLLSMSIIESQMVEFKIGITYFESGEINDKEIKKICRTLVAMANTDCKRQKEGYIIIGIANNLSSCNKWKNIYKEMPLTYGTHKIVGISGEATKYFEDEDLYERRFCDLIKKEPITESLKEYVLSNLRIADFKGKNLLLLPSIKQNEICYYDNKYYIREGSKTTPIKEKDLKAP